jgi:3-dehydroquinate synthase
VSAHFTVHVGLAQAQYDITIFSSAEFSDASTDVSVGPTAHVLNDLRPLTHVVVITDNNVAALHAIPFAEKCRGHVDRVDLITVPAGEASKSIEQADRLWQQMLEVGADRQTVVAAVGGGVVGDLAGFVAATYARGVRFLQVPTTLLAQVDSSVGGKVGINLPHAKNLVGAFWQPAAVIIDTAALSTLPDREFRSGIAEVVKYGVIMDEPFFEYLDRNVTAIIQREPQALKHIVARCCQLKSDVVEADETETTGRRAILNYGHTFAHAFESVGGYGRLLHGEAVAIGMTCAARLAERRGMVPGGFTDRQVKVLQAFDLPTTTPDYDVKKLLAAMKLDKKTSHGKIHFILPEHGMGKMTLVGDITNNEILAALG